MKFAVKINIIELMIIVKVKREKGVKLYAKLLMTSTEWYFVPCFRSRVHFKATKKKAKSISEKYIHYIYSL